MISWTDALRDMLADVQLAVPIWKPEITSRTEIDAQGLQLPLVVVWGVKDAGENMDMTVSINMVRLEFELRHRLMEAVPIAEWSSTVDQAQRSVGEYAQSFLANLVDLKLPVPLCLEPDARQALLKAPA